MSFLLIACISSENICFWNIQDIYEMYNCDCISVIDCISMIVSPTGNWKYKIILISNTTLFCLNSLNCNINLQLHKWIIIKLGTKADLVKMDEKQSVVNHWKNISLMHSLLLKNVNFLRLYPWAVLQRICFCQKLIKITEIYMGFSTGVGRKLDTAGC